MKKYNVYYLKDYDLTRIRRFFNDNHYFVIDSDFIKSLAADTEDFFNRADCYEFDTLEEAENCFNLNKQNCTTRILNINRNVREHDSDISIMNYGHIIGIDCDLRVDVLMMETAETDEDDELCDCQELDFYIQPLKVRLNKDLTIEQEVNNEH